MKITGMQFEKIKIKLTKPFVVAFTVIEYCETIIIKLTTDEGICGYGEASPLPLVTAETLDTVTAALDLLRPSIIGKNPFDIELIHCDMDKSILGNSSAKAGIDLAVYDLMGKNANLPVYRLLGGYTNNMISDITIGIDKPELMAQEALERVKRDGYRILKVKAGISPADDIHAIKLIRQAVGDDIRIRVDANQGWDVNTSITTIKAFEQYNVDAVEQPLPHWDIEGSAIVRRRSSIRIMLDESLHSPVDAANIIKAGAADTLNIKLMKSAGLYPALKINSIAEACGVNCMVGCMLETKLGISAAASLVASQRNITEADVDSFLYFDDNTVTGGFTMDKDIITMSEKPGFGVDVNF